MCTRPGLLPAFLEEQIEKMLQKTICCCQPTTEVQESIHTQPVVNEDPPRLFGVGIIYGKNKNGAWIVRSMTRGGVAGDIAYLSLRV
jgi:hypothetical protein